MEVMAVKLATSGRPDPACPKCGGSGNVTRTSGPVAFRTVKCACTRKAGEGRL
jgi:DnaJ-class molecular chaperone